MTMNSFIYYIIPLMVFFISCLSFILNRKHLLLTLLCLEFIMLNLFFALFLYYYLNMYDMYMLMFYLVLVVCEGALGLSILVSMIRTHGNNYFQSFNLMC